MISAGCGSSREGGLRRFCGRTGTGNCGIEPEDRRLEPDYLQQGQRREMRLTDQILGLPEPGGIAIGMAVLESVPGGAGNQTAIVGAGFSSAFAQE